MRINDQISIEETLLSERFVRASGAGGQHVNKTSSAVQLRFDVAASALTASVKQRLKRIAGSRMTQEGVLVLHVEDHRSQERNRIEARNRLRRLVDQASKAPKPRLKSRPSLNSIKKQKDRKTQKSQAKALRRKPTLE